MALENYSEQVLQEGSARLRLRWLSARCVRITHATGDGADFPTDRPWMQDVFSGLLSAQPDGKVRYKGGVTDDERGLRIGLVGGCARVETRTGELLLQDGGAGKRNCRGTNRFSFQTQPGEAFYGWGEWFNAFRRTSGKLVLHARESYSVLQGRQTYSTIPFFLSNRGYGLFLLDSRPTTWQLSPERGTLTVRAGSGPLDYILIYGPAYKDILEAYTGLTGRPPLPPLWAFGLWVTSYPQGSQQGVLAHVEEHRRRQIPLDAVILDYHWEERFHNFRWRRSLFPDPDAMFGALRRLGMRLGLIFTPFLNRRNQPLKKILLQAIAKDIPKGILFTDERALPEYQEALHKGYLAHAHAEWWFGKGGMFDFSNPEASAWWLEKMKPLFAQGVDFFKNDDGEYLPLDARSGRGLDGREYHNLYGFYYGKALYEGMQALDDRRGLVYARSVWAGSQRYPGMFLGDQKPTFACIRRTLRAGMNLGLAGFAYWTADVFGLDGKTSEETHMRYAQWALLSPIARYFWRPPEVDDTRFPWSHGTRAEANFREHASLRYRLLPDYYTLAWQAWQRGLPILRPMLLEHQADERFADVYDQVMLGDALLLAPMVEPEADTRHILLPQGVWHDFWSTQYWLGPGEIDYPAPLERLPLLVRGGAILPLGPVIQSIPDGHRFTELSLHIYPPYPASGLLYEDDGCTRAYQEGNFRLTRFHLSQRQGTAILQIQPDGGSYTNSNFERGLEAIFHQVENPKGIFVEHARLQEWWFAADACELHIRILVQSTQPAAIHVQLA